MKRSCDVLNIAVPAEPGDPCGLIGDIRVRVDLEALGRVFAARAIKKRGNRVALYNDALTVEAFNVRTEKVAEPGPAPAAGIVEPAPDYEAGAS